MKSAQNSEKLLQSIFSIFSEKIPFNRVLGLRLDFTDINHPTLKFDMRDELIGNFIHGNLHGGVISSALDVIGGLTAFIGALNKMEGKSELEKVEKFSRLGTIDLRIDYLRPGKGNSFVASGSVLRTGNKVAVTRMELHNDNNLLIAVGTGTYLVG